MGLGSAQLRASPGAGVRAAASSVGLGAPPAGPGRGAVAGAGCLGPQAAEQSLARLPWVIPCSGARPHKAGAPHANEMGQEEKPNSRASQHRGLNAQGEA